MLLGEIREFESPQLKVSNILSVNSINTDKAEWEFRISTSNLQLYFLNVLDS
jgi:hypothetical protein